MVSVYDHKDYREYLNDWIDSQGPKGRGLKSRLAQAAGVSSTLISLVLSGAKQLSIEQALECADFVGFNENESDYFILLVEHARAGTVKLRLRLQKKLQVLKEKSQRTSHRIEKNLELDDSLKAVYYSSWLYSGIRNLVAVKGFQTVEDLAQKLHLPHAVVNRVVQFLIDNQLCLLRGDKIVHGTAYTYIPPESPLVVKHHQNWRLQGFTHMDRFSKEDYFFTSPLSLSHKAASEIRKRLLGLVEQTFKLTGPSASEKTACLNIDWFEY